MRDFENIKLKERVLQISGASDFTPLALDIFHYQYRNNLVYKKFVDLLGINVSKVGDLYAIPFMPIEFYKTFDVTSHFGVNTARVFESSGTTGANTSRHLVYDEKFYLNVANRIFQDYYGTLNEYVILALLPSYLERQNSSLVSMVQHFIQFAHPDSGFYLNDFKSLQNQLNLFQDTSQKVILWGVTFALLDFADFFDKGISENIIIMETGGMKGRKKELTRHEVHEILCNKLDVSKVNSEYGMTELFSQAYSKGDGIFEMPYSMRILIREINDPLSYVGMGKRGGINVIDLANIDTCSFISTQDLGIIHDENQFEVLGRFDASDVRGCNLLV